ncbi:MAG: ABC transporter ATP-binding protein [Planctomycetes bacterium]|nr:ABC transporter ATP-binding protein [Planctomycetota bacterium]
MFSLSGISKRFGAVTALAEVSLTITTGRVHGLLGENGAGKSTLMNILFGLLQPDAGSITSGGTALRLRSPAEALRHGLGMVHQHFALVPTLSVVDNVVLALQSSLGRVDRAAWSARLRQRADALRWDIDPAALVGSLATGQQQRVEILKALLAIDQAGSAQRTLILDEPTAVLTPPEVDELLPSVRALAADGVAVVYISHKLAEIARVCDEVSVLRRGRMVHHGPASETQERLAELMVGSPVSHPARPACPAPLTAAVRIAARDIAIRIDGRTVLQDVTLEVRAGEIVGIAGVEGNGQVPLVQALLGLLPPTSGTLTAPSPIAVIPDDRQREALVMPLSVAQNLALRRYRGSPFSHHGWLSPAAWSTHARALMSASDVRAPSPGAAMATLSGGNQQKAVVARELDGDPPVIIAVNPTRGLDVGAASAVLERLVAARDRGAAVLLIHSDLDELLAVSDRVLVLHRGSLADSGWPTCDRAAIGRLMLGGLPLGPRAADPPDVDGLQSPSIPGATS